MTKITFDDLTDQELDDFNELINSAITNQLIMYRKVVVSDLDDEQKSQRSSYHDRLISSFENIVKKMTVEN